MADRLAPRRSPTFAGATIVLLALLAGCAVRPLPPVPPAPPPTIDSAQQCLKDLDARGVAYTPAPVPVAANGCGIANGVRVTAMTIAWNQPGELSCAMALRLDDFLREVVDPAALRHFGHHVARLDHRGAYSCRRESTGRNRLSQHAFGNAIDVSGFVLDDGTRVAIAADWTPRGARRDFLREVASQACTRFSVVLTPASNSDHLDHFHLDIGPSRLCGAP